VCHNPFLNFNNQMREGNSDLRGWIVKLVWFLIENSIFASCAVHLFLLFSQIWTVIVV
jgi:hypothetical protein